MSAAEKREAALLALRAAVAAKTAYWDASLVLEKALGFNSGEPDVEDDIPDAVSDEIHDYVELCAGGGDAEWITEAMLDDLHKLIGATP